MKQGGEERRRGRRLAAIAGVIVALGARAACAEPDAGARPVADSTATPPAAVATSAPADTAPAAADTAAATRGSPNPRVESTRMVKLIGSGQNVVRTGPGASYAIVGVYPKNKSFPVIAKSGEWYDIRISETQTGWVHSSLCKEYDDLSRLEFRPNPKLYSRTGAFVLCAYAGGYSFDRKSNSLVLGGRVGYYVFDRIQAEAGLAWTHIHRPGEIVENLFNLSLEAENFNMIYYHMNLMWEVLPGRQMVPFVTGGVGTSIMLGRTEPSVNFGAGTTLFLSKRTAMRWEVRDYRFDSGPEGARRTNNNIEFSLGTEFLY